MQLITNDPKYSRLYTRQQIAQIIDQIVLWTDSLDNGGSGIPVGLVKNMSPLLSALDVPYDDTGSECGVVDSVQLLLVL